MKRYEAEPHVCVYGWKEGLGSDSKSISVCRGEREERESKKTVAAACVRFLLHRTSERLKGVPSQGTWHQFLALPRKELRPRSTHGIDSLPGWNFRPNAHYLKLCCEPKHRRNVRLEWKSIRRTLRRPSSYDVTPRRVFTPAWQRLH
jgi:hypothetical protein